MVQEQAVAAPRVLTQVPRERRFGWARWLWQAARKKPLGAISALIILLLVVMAAFPFLFTPYDPLATNVEEVLQPPSERHPMGTDEVGRDLMSRIVYGSRVTIQVGFVAVGIGVVFGSILGLISGYAQGPLDWIIQRIMDALMAVPFMVLALVIISVLGSSTINSMLAIGILIIPSVSRTVRGSVLSIKQNVYVEAARAIGASAFRIAVVHIFPNVVAPIIVIASGTLGVAILVEASLSFLGLGTPLPQPSWGMMLSGAGRRFMETNPHLAIFPCLAISVAVLAFNLLGDAIRDLLDPKLRGSTGSIR